MKFTDRYDIYGINIRSITDFEKFYTFALIFICQSQILWNFHKKKRNISDWEKNMSAHSANQEPCCHNCSAGTTAGESERERGGRGEVCLQKWQHNPPPVWPSVGRPGQSRERFQLRKNKAIVQFVKINLKHFSQL